MEQKQIKYFHNPIVRTAKFIMFNQFFLVSSFSKVKIMRIVAE